MWSSHQYIKALDIAFSTGKNFKKASGSPSFPDIKEMCGKLANVVCQLKMIQ